VLNLKVLANGIGIGTEEVAKPEKVELGFGVSAIDVDVRDMSPVLGPKDKVGGLRAYRPEFESDGPCGIGP
jgi:hypothetical protein